MVIAMFVSCATLGLKLIFNKLRDSAATSLMERDVADQKIGKMLVRELTDMKNKLEAQSRAKLLASIEFLEAGVLYLYHFFEDVGINKEAGGYEELSAKKISTESSDENAATSQDGYEINSKAMQDIMSRLQGIKLDDLSQEATQNLRECKERFKEARKEATKAYSDESLSLIDRVLALKIRIIATILENVDTPNVSVADECNLCVEKLNRLPQVLEAFKSTSKTSGALSKLKDWALGTDEERTDFVSTVAEINFVVWKYECLCRKRNVPIHDLSYFNQAEASHPISESYWYSKTLNLDSPVCVSDMKVTSEGDIFVICGMKIKVFSRDGDPMHSFEVPAPDYKSLPKGIAIDENTDKIYVCFNDNATISVFTTLGECPHQFNVQEDAEQHLLIKGIATSNENLLVLTQYDLPRLTAVSRNVGGHENHPEVVLHVFSTKDMPPVKLCKKKMPDIPYMPYCFGMITTDEGYILVFHGCTITVLNKNYISIGNITAADDGICAIVYNPITRQLVTAKYDSRKLLLITLDESFHELSRKKHKHKNERIRIDVSLALTSDGKIAFLDGDRGTISFINM